MNRSSLLLGLMCLGCSAPSSTSDAGAASDDAGVVEDGGAPADAGAPDAGYVLRILDGGVGIAVPAGVDPFALTLERVNDTSDGGLTSVVRLGPDGTTFTPPAFVATSVSLDPGSRDPDASVALPIWVLMSADGGGELVSSSTTLTFEPGLTLTGLVTAVVPHFSVFGWLPGVDARMDLLPHGSLEVDQVFVASVDLFGSKMSGSLEFTWSGAIENAAPNSTNTFVDAQTPSSRLALRCRTTGPGTVEAHVRFTDIEVEREFLDFRGLVQGARQDLHLRRSVFCHEPIPPGSPPPLPSAPSVSLTPTPTELPANGEPAALQLGQALAGELSRNDVVVASLALPCGVGQGPCELGVRYRATFTLTTLYRNAFGGVLVVYASASGGIDPNAWTSRALPLTPMSPQSFDFVFTCRRPGTYRLRGGYEHVSENREETGSFVELGVVRCGGRGDAVMLSDNTRLTRSGASWVAQPTGVTANVIAATEALEAKFGAIDSQNVAYDTVTAFESRLGLPRIELRSSQQRAVFAHDGTRYVQRGLVGMPAYAANDLLTVTGQLADGGTATFADGGPAVVTFAAPPPLPNPAQLLGPRAGLSTVVRLPDGTFDALFVTLGARSPRGGEGGLLRTVPAEEMTLNAGVREAPLLDDASLRAVRAWGLDAGTIYFAAYRQRSVEGLFTESDGGLRAVPIQAGRMVQVNVADLVP